MTTTLKTLLTAVTLSVALPALADDKPAAAAGEASAVVKAATEIQNREPVGEATQFKKGDKIYVWSQLRNLEGQSIDHVWKKDGKELYRAHLDVGSKSWRTNSRRQNAQPGSYVVEVMQGETQLGSIAFTVGE